MQWSDYFGGILLKLFTFARCSSLDLLILLNQSYFQVSTKKGDKEDPFGVFNFTSPSMRRRDGDESSSDGKFKLFT